VQTPLCTGTVGGELVNREPGMNRAAFILPGSRLSTRPFSAPIILPFPSRFPVLFGHTSQLVVKNVICTQERCRLMCEKSCRRARSSPIDGIAPLAIVKHNRCTSEWALERYFRYLPMPLFEQPPSFHQGQTPPPCRVSCPTQITHKDSPVGSCPQATSAILAHQFLRLSSNPAFLVRESLRRFCQSVASRHGSA
jgi:hypothetical protein